MPKSTLCNQKSSGQLPFPSACSRRGASQPFCSHHDFIRQFTKENTWEENRSLCPLRRADHLMERAALYPAEGTKYHPSKTPVFAIGMTWVNSKPWLSKYLRHTRSTGEVREEYGRCHAYRVKDPVPSLKYPTRFRRVAKRRWRVPRIYLAIWLTSGLSSLRLVLPFQMTERTDLSSFPPATIMFVATRCRAFFYTDLQEFDPRLNG